MEEVFDNTRPHVGGEAMSEKAERPLKDVIEPSKFPSKFTSGMGRRSKNPAASAVDNERPQEGQFPRGRVPSEFPKASAADKAIYRVTS